MTRTQLENLLRAKLHCSYVYLQEGKHKEMFIAYKEAMGMYEVLKTFFPSVLYRSVAFYYYTCRSAEMQQNDFEKWAKLNVEIEEKLLTDS